MAKQDGQSKRPSGISQAPDEQTQANAEEDEFLNAMATKAVDDILDEALEGIPAAEDVCADVKAGQAPADETNFTEQAATLDELDELLSQAYVSQPSTERTNQIDDDNAILSQGDLDALAAVAGGLPEQDGEAQDDETHLQDHLSIPLTGNADPSSQEDLEALSVQPGAKAESADDGISTLSQAELVALLAQADSVNSADQQQNFAGEADGRCEAGSQEDLDSQMGQSASTGEPATWDVSDGEMATSQEDLDATSSQAPAGVTGSRPASPALAEEEIPAEASTTAGDVPAADAGDLDDLLASQA
ncbi:MAG: hypothetical protein HQ546_11270, partial [Planctomycetes bacterium]|nr:hypothetical protein [Planctomycetota bacterium]